MPTSEAEALAQIWGGGERNRASYPSLSRVLNVFQSEFTLDENRLLIDESSTWVLGPVLDHHMGQEVIHLVCIIYF